MSMAATKLDARYSYADHLQWDHGKRCEFIHGIVHNTVEIVMPREAALQNERSGGVDYRPNWH